MVAPLAIQTCRPFVIVDIGARALREEEHIYAPLLASPHEWRCIGFEPQQHRIEERQQSEGDSRLVLFPHFVGEGKDETFHIASEDGSSSLLPLNTFFNADFEDICKLKVVRTEEARTRRLDDLLRGESYIDFLKLDIQGYEGHALAGAGDVLRRTNVVHCEVFFGPMYVGGALFSDIESILRAAGFSFMDFHHLNRYEYVSVQQRTGQRERLIWGDAIFFRDIGPSVATRADLVAQAAIASLVYGKNGLAQKLLLIAEESATG